MKKTSLLALLCIAWSATSAYAECYVNADTVLHFDPYRFASITRIATVGGVSEQLARAIDKDLEDGVAVQVPRGTKINEVIQLVDQDYAVVKVKGTICFMLQKHLSCD